ncbi:MAG TPA: BolA family protein, partial [Candidatus Polarisedimenticolia bacterium]|nr:BolA family protein [Candidatus Polarisedimenticolia bacterium]
GRAHDREPGRRERMRPMATTREKVESILRHRLQPLHLEIQDDSTLHAGHAGAVSGGGHFEVLVVSAAFEGKALLEQHRLVNDALHELIGGEIHALSIKTVPASRWKG